MGVIIHYGIRLGNGKYCMVRLKADSVINDSISERPRSVSSYSTLGGIVRYIVL